MKRFLTFALPLLLIICSYHKVSAQVKNYYNIPGELTFDSLQYKLSASYHPNDNYYKQEYIPSGESADHFKKMVTIDFVVADVKAKDLVTAKIKELQQRKKSDPVVQTDLMSNAERDEYILDFILSEQAGGKLTIVERNVYRYKNYTDSTGHKGVLLFAVSQRGYGDDIVSFFGNLKKNRVNDINKVAKYDMPNVQIQN
ncbi:MAG: hypothetical protein JST19_14705 [Bacteroidetes bacterium]|nr:hypothetical protein [Bacteroidota bacterium]